MNELEQLRKDMKEAINCTFHEGSAALHVLDAFMDSHEVVEVVLDKLGPPCYWTDTGAEATPERTWLHIIVPKRKQEPSLREAARAVVKAHAAVEAEQAYARPDLYGALTALAAALKRESDDE